MPICADCFAVGMVTKMEEYQIFTKLVKLAMNSYPSKVTQSSALVICPKERYYFGTAISLSTFDLKITALACAIYNAVSEGQREDMKVFVFCHSEKEILSETTLDLLREFKIGEITVWLDNCENKKIINLTKYLHEREEL